MKFIWITGLLAFFSWNTHPSTATNFENLDEIERIDQGNNPINCVPIASEAGRCNDFRITNPRTIIRPEDCIDPFTNDNIENTCVIDKNLYYFRDYILFNGCLFGRKSDGSCIEFDIKDTCESRKKRLQRYKFALCSDGKVNACVSNKKYGLNNGKEMKNVNNFFQLDLNYALKSGTHIEFYYNKNYNDIAEFEKDWKHLITKFTLCHDFFISCLKDYNAQYHREIEKWCLLHTIDDYYHYNDNFKDKTNVLRFGAHDVKEAYNEIKTNYTATSKDTFRLYVESNKDKHKAFESQFTILLYDPVDENIIDVDACAKS